MAFTLLAFDTFKLYDEKNDLNRQYDAVAPTLFEFSKTGGVFNGPRITYVAASAESIVVLQKAVTGTQRFIFGGWIKAIGTSTGVFLCFRPIATSTTQINFRFNNGVLETYRSTTLLNSVSVSLSEYTFMEVYAYIHDTLGEISVFLNGAEVVTLTALDTRSSTTSLLVDRIDFRPGSGAGSECGPWYFGSCDAKTDRKGPIQGFLLLPSADTADDDFIPSSGTDAFAMIDDAPDDDDVTYIKSNVNGDKSVFDLTNLTAGTFGAIIGAKAFVIVRAEDYTDHKFKLGLKSGAVYLYDVDAYPTLAYNMRTVVTGVDPNTSAAWTGTNLNAAQVSLELTS